MFSTRYFKRPVWLSRKRIVLLVGVTLISGFVADTVRSTKVKAEAEEAKITIDSMGVETDSLKKELKEATQSRKDTTVLLIPYDEKGAVVRLSKKDLNNIASMVVEKIKSDSSFHRKSYMVPEFIVTVDNGNRKE